MKALMVRQQSRLLRRFKSSCLAKRMTIKSAMLRCGLNTVRLSFGAFA